MEYKTIVDLAGWGDTKGKARNVVLTGSKDSKNHLWVARLDVGRFTPTEVINLFKSHARQFKSVIRIEEIQYQRAIAHFSKQQMEETGEWFQQEALPYDGRKDAKNLRIRALEPLISNGALHVLSTMSKLLEELELYPYAATVDILDCLGYLFRVTPAMNVEAKQELINPFQMSEIEKELKNRHNSAVGYPFQFQNRLQGEFGDA